MARVDYSGVPDVAPQATPPEDYEHIQASPNAFGADVAAGLGDIGQNLTNDEHFYGQVAADNATNNTLQQITGVLYGDPSKPAVGPDGNPVMGPDGKPVPDTGYFGLRGADAMKAREDVSTKIDEIIAENRGGLLTPRSGLQYDADTRRMRAQWLREVGAHADQQQRTWATDTNNTSAALALNQIGAKPGDDATITAGTDAVRRAFVRNAQLNGEDPAGAILKADQTIAKTRIQAVLPNDPVAAQRLLNENQGLLSSMPGYDALADTVRAQSRAVESTSIADATLARAASGQPPTAGPVPPKGSIAATNLANNNPGNIRVPGQKAFQSFPTRQAGIDAVGAQITRDIDVHGLKTIRALISDPTWGYAPASDHNDTAAYIASVQHQTGLDPDKPINAADIPKIRDAMIAVEQGHGGSSGAAPAPVSAIPPRQKNTSIADYYRQNYTGLLDQADREAAAARPNDPVFQAQTRARVEQRMNDAIRQQELQYSADNHLVLSAAVTPDPAGNRPTSLEQLTADPNVKAAWDRMQINDPAAAYNLETRVLPANARGVSTNYGNRFWEFYQRAMAPDGDPSRVHDTKGFYGAVGSGPNAALTNTGLQALQQAIAIRNTPQGNATAHAELDFFRKMHGELSNTNPNLLTYDAKGEKQFELFMIAAQQQIQAGLKSGKGLPQMFDPKSPDYVGKLAPAYQRNITQRLHDTITYMPSGVQAHGDAIDVSTPDGLRKAVTSGQMSRADGETLALKNGWIRANAPPPPQVPLEH